MNSTSKKIDLNKRKFDVKLAIIILFFSISLTLIVILLYFFYKSLCLSAPEDIDPIGFQVSSNTDGSIQVSWIASYRATYYIVYVKQGSSPGETYFTQKVQTSNTTYRFTDLQPEKQWYFAVQAFNKCGKNNISVSKFIIPCPVVGLTSIISATLLPETLLTDYSYRLSISESVNATQYLVQVYQIEANVPDVIVANQTFTNNECTLSLCDFNKINLIMFPTQRLQYRFEVTPSNSCFVSTKKTSIISFI